MTGTKRSTLLQSSLLSPTSSKLTSQYIVKNNLAHHYRILQNVSSCIDNSTPQSLLKSQKIRDRNKHKKRPASHSSGCSLTRSRPASQTQQEMYYGNTYNLQEDWKEAFKDVADDDELYQIVRATLGRKPDHSFMTDYYSDDGSKDGYYGFNQSSRLSSYDDRYSASSNFPPSRQSQAFSSSSRSMKNSKKSSHLLMKDKPGDVLQSRTHVFTQPEKAFTPRILKTSKKSLLSECKYYNPPKFRKSKAESESQKDKKEKLSDQSETSNYPDPESLTESTSYISSRSSKSHSTLVEEPVPQLDLLPDKEGRSDKTKVKKHTRNNTKENIILENENSDLKNTTLSRHKSKLNSTDNAFKTQNSSKAPSDLYQSNATSSHLQSPKALNEINKSSECEYINFMKHVTEDILLKGLFTNRAIQQVFEFHIMKHRGKLDEEKMRRMLMNFLQDIGIKPERDATFNGNTSTSNELNNFPSYSGLNLSENLSKSISLINKSEECHQKNLEKLMASMSDFNVSETEEENLVKENPQPEVSLARKQRHQSSHSKQRNDISIVIANHTDEDTEVNKFTCDEKQISDPNGDKINFTKDCDNKQNNKPVPRPRRKNSSPNVLQESAHVKVMTSIVKTLDPDIFCEKAAGDSIVSKDSFQEDTAPVDISLKPANYVSEMKTSEPVKTTNHLTMFNNSSNMMNLASDKSDRKSQLEPNSVCSESSPNHEPTANPSQINQSPDSPVNNQSDNQVDEQNDYDEDNFDSVDSDSDF